MQSRLLRLPDESLSKVSHEMYSVLTKLSLMNNYMFVYKQ